MSPFHSITVLRLPKRNLASLTQVSIVFSGTAENVGSLSLPFFLSCIKKPTGRGLKGPDMAVSMGWDVEAVKYELLYRDFLVSTRFCRYDTV